MTTTSESSATLIVGGDSLVGKSYRQHLERQSRPVISTTRRLGPIADSTVYLDLADDMGRWSCPINVGVAVLCAGITKFATCKSDPLTTSRVNVTGMSALAKNLIQNGVRIIYLSTAVVFDGLLPHRKSDDELCPNTEYGRQNAQAETQIIALDKSVTVLRLTKTLGPATPLLTQWTNSLQNGQQVHPYSNLVMAPIPVDFAVDIIDRVAVSPVSGIFQASGNKDVTYEEAAHICASTLGADPQLIQSIRVNDENNYTEPIPQNTTLDTHRLESEFGIEIPDVEQTLHDLFSVIGPAVAKDPSSTRRADVSIK